MPHCVVVPLSGDANRGDQALVWETVRVARDAGYDGDFYMLAASRAEQSVREGIVPLEPLIKHPGRGEGSNNAAYRGRLALRWASQALLDLMRSALLLFPWCRPVGLRLLSVNQKRTMELIASSEACLVKGGGFLHSEQSLVDVYKTYFHLFPVFLALSFRVPVLVMPNSFGPFDSRIVAWMVRRALSGAALVCARESLSQSTLDELGIEAKLAPDLGFFLTRSIPESHPLEAAPGLGDVAAMRRVAITVRPYRFPGQSDPAARYSSYVESIAGFCKWLFRNGYFPSLVEQVCSLNSHESDAVAIKAVSLLLEEGQYTTVSNPDYDCRDLKRIYSEHDFVVGTRFHSVIFGMSEQVPSLAVTYGGHKGDGIMADCALSEFAIPIEEISTDRLVEAFERLVASEDQVHKRIEACLREFQRARGDLVSWVNAARGLH